MRVLLVGAAADRARTRALLEESRIEVAGEFPSLAAARASGIDADAIVVGDVRQHEDLVEPLTRRERDVLELRAEGLSNKSIAARLAISDQTVKFHVAAIAGKLGAANRTDIVRRAARRGLIAL